MQTIKSHTEISSLFNEGEKFYSTGLVIIKSKVKQHDHEGRVAFIAGKRHGNAVWRNKAKRRLRALCKEWNGPWEGFDVLLVAKATLNDEAYSKIFEHGKKTLYKAKLIQENEY